MPAACGHPCKREVRFVIATHNTALCQDVVHVVTDAEASKKRVREVLLYIANQQDQVAIATATVQKRPAMDTAAARERPAIDIAAVRARPAIDTASVRQPLGPKAPIPCWTASSNK